MRDFSVWNEPAHTITTAALSGGADYSPFYCRGPHEYAPARDRRGRRLPLTLPPADIVTCCRYSATYMAVYSRAKAQFGDAVQIGIALSAAQPFSRTVLADLKGNGSSFDFVDNHQYPNTPSALPWSIYGRPAMNIEYALEEAGFERTTRISIGEWSRSIGLNYATDGPGAAFVACGLTYLNAMTSANSGGAHNVADAYLFAASKIWTASSATQWQDRPAAAVLDWWSLLP